MSRTKKDTFENFYFAVDDWVREYQLEINRYRWQLDLDHQSERGENLYCWSAWHKNKAKSYIR
jgi:hypothetical protein